MKKDAAVAEQTKVREHFLDLVETAEDCLDRCRGKGLGDGLEQLGADCRKALDEVCRQSSNDLAAAGVACSNVIAQCRKLEELCGQRDMAKSSREAMEDARTKAKGARDKKNLKTAEAARASGETAFAALRFAEAVVEFDKANNAYWAAVATEARVKDKAERRKAEKERKKEADRVKREKEIEEYRRKYYQKPRENESSPSLEPITYWQDGTGGTRMKPKGRVYRRKH